MRKFPVVQIDIDTPYFVGKIKALGMQQPVYDLILGNLPGVLSPTESDIKPLTKQVFSQSQHGINQTTKDETHQVEQNDKVKHTRCNDVSAVVQTRSHKHKAFKSLKVASTIADDVTPDSIKQEQQTDCSLKKVRESVESEN